MVSRDTQDAQVIGRQAAEWYVRWSDEASPVGPREQADWLAWLQHSPKHIEAYFALDNMCDRLTAAPALKSFDVDDWMAGRRAVVRKIGDTGSTRTAVIAPSQTPRYPRRIWTRRQRFLAAAALILIVGAAFTLGRWILSESQTYRTGLGEQNTFRLADGSVLQLNTRSHARVSYTRHARTIDLDGEGLFTVTPDIERPFTVRTHDATVRAIGTRFNVYDQGGATKIAVIEGQVRVSSPRQALDLAAGEEATVSAGSAAKVTHPNTAVAVAWQNRVLVFQRALLSDVAREFNRYNTIQFSVAASVGETDRLSGTFDARHPQSLLLWLQSRADIKVTRQARDVYLVEEAGASIQKP